MIPENKDENINLINKEVDHGRESTEEIDENISIEELKMKNDDEIVRYFFKKHLSDTQRSQFEAFFYKGSSSKADTLKSSEFVSVGIFEDLTYFSWWLNNEDMNPVVNFLKNDFGLAYWRRIKGDGNCYYRSILISFLEIFILNSIEYKQPEIFLSVIKDIFFTPFPPDKQKFKVKTITVLLVIYENIQLSIDGNNVNGKFFDVLYQAYNKSDVFEKTLIMWLRIKLKLFLKENLDLELNGIKLVQCIPGFELDDDMSFDKAKVNLYIDNELTKMNEYVEGYPLYITPFIFKMSINIFCIESGAKPLLMEMGYFPELPFQPIESYIQPPHKEKINIMFRIPHYDSLYTRLQVENILKSYGNPNLCIIEGQLDENEYSEYKSDVLGISRLIQYERNPLANLLEGKTNKADNFNHSQPTSITIDISQVSTDEQNSRTQKYFNMDKYTKKQKTHQQPSASKTFLTCTLCNAESNNLIYYPCKHSFCLDCFEIFFNKCLNHNPKAEKTPPKTQVVKEKTSYNVKDLTFEDVERIFKTQKKYKFIKCLNEICEEQIDLKDKFLYNIIERYQTLIFKIKEEKEKVAPKLNKEAQDKQKTKKKCDNNSEKFCRVCKRDTFHVSLPCTCEICVECQKKEVFKKNGKDHPIAFNSDGVITEINCCECDGYVLIFEDYQLLFTSTELENAMKY